VASVPAPKPPSWFSWDLAAFGRRVRDLRVSKGWSRQEFAKRVDQLCVKLELHAEYAVVPGTYVSDTTRKEDLGEPRSRGLGLERFNAAVDILEEVCHSPPVRLAVDGCRRRTESVNGKWIVRFLNDNKVTTSSTLSKVTSHSGFLLERVPLAKNRAIPLLFCQMFHPGMRCIHCSFFSRPKAEHSRSHEREEGSYHYLLEIFLRVSSKMPVAEGLRPNNDTFL